MSFSKISMFTAGTALLLLGACTDGSQYNGDQQASNQQQGALVGAMVGAIAGMAASNDADQTKGAILGAAIGGIAGSILGERLDQQAADLRRDMGNDQVQIVNTGRELVVTMPQDILFATDSATVRNDLQRDLQALAGNLMAYPDTTVQVIGHTDNTGAASYNQALSLRRAKSVTQVLINAGVPNHRLRATGMGENQPVATNLSPEGRRQNRRVEIVLTPNI